MIEANQDVIDLVIYVHEVGKQEITSEGVMTLLDILNVEHPHIVFAQMRLESGNFKSDLAKNNNNFFGMKYPRQRATIAQGNDRGYAYYRSWSYSVLDYAIWQRRYASGLTEDEYLEMLSEKYAEDKAYNFIETYDLVSPLEVVLVRISDGSAFGYRKLKNLQEQISDPVSFTENLTNEINNFLGDGSSGL